MKVDGIFSGQNFTVSVLSEILSKINVGDMLRAQLIEISANEVLLKLFDGTTLSAATLSSVDAKPGEFVDFIVKGRNDSQLILETVKNPPSNAVNPDNLLEKFLISEGIRPDEANINLAKEIKANNLSLSKEVFNRVLDIISQFKAMGMTAEKAVFMVKNGIDPTPVNIKALNQIADERFKITDSVKELINSLSSIKDNRLLEVIKSSLAAVDLKYNKNMADQLPLKNADTSVNGHNQEKIFLIQNPGELAKKIINNLIETMDAGSGDAFSELIKKTGMEEKLAKFIKYQQDSDIDINTKVIQFLTSEIQKGLKLLPQRADSLFDKILNALRQLKTLEMTLPKQEFYGESRDFFNKVFSTALLKTDEREIQVQGSLKAAYKELFDKLETVKQEIINSPYALKNEIIERIDNIHNNIRFINEICNYSAYFQIPLNFKGNNETAQLYILKRNPGKKKLDPDNLTVYLSLDTQNIGRVDSLININKKNIILNFRLEDKNLSEHFLSLYNDLYNILKNKGYKLIGMNFGSLDRSINLVNAQKKLSEEIENTRCSIDYKI